jgi:hypothetical protein
MRTILLAAFLLTIPAASAQFQVTHDVPNTSTSPHITPLILNDGHVVTWQWHQGTSKLRKYTSEGELLWSKEMQGGNSLWSLQPLFCITKDNSNGFVIAEHMSTTFNEDSIWMDTQHFEHRYKITKFNGAGAVTSAFEISKSYSTSWSNWHDPRRMRIGTTAEGDLVLAINYSNSFGGASTDVIRLGPSGEVIWSRNAGPNPSPWENDPLPTYTLDPFATMEIAYAPDGALYFTIGNDMGPSHLRLMKLDAAGNLLWAKRYVYTNSVTSVGYDEIQVDAAGNVHAAGYLNTTVGRFHIFLVIDPEGQLLRADIYRSALPLQNLGFRLDAQGQRYHLVRTQPDPFLAVYKQALLRADTLGSTAQLFSRQDHVVLPHNVFIPFQAMDVMGEDLVLSGTLHHEHVDLAFTTRYESLLRFATDDLGHCFSQDSALAHIAVPLSITNTQVLDDYASISVAQFYDTAPAPSVTNPLPDEPLVDLCDLGSELLGLPIGVSEAPRAAAQPLVHQNLVAAGTMILLHGDGTARVEVWTNHGALKYTARISGDPMAIPTTGWSSGVYLVRALDHGGGTIAVERVVLE